MLERQRSEIRFNFQKHLLGGVSTMNALSMWRLDDYHGTDRNVQCSIDAHGKPLTDEALSAAKNADAIILGAIGGPVRPHPPTSTPISQPFLEANQSYSANRNGAPAPSVPNKASSPSANPSPHSATSALAPSPPKASSRAPRSKSPSAAASTSPSSAN